MFSAFKLLAASVAVCGTVTAVGAIEPSTYTPGPFPTTAYSEYYNSPTATSAQVQPVISDPVLHTTYPFSLTSPDDLAQNSNDTEDPHPLPTAVSASTLVQQAVLQVQSIAENPTFANDTCAQCQASLAIAKMVVLAAPEQGPALAVALCEAFNYSTTCEAEYGRYDLASPITQVVAYFDAGGYDGQTACYEFLSLCPMPTTSPLDLTGWFATPKPDPLPAPKTPSGERLKVLHLSDFHIDPRYDTGAEANCSQYLCCRQNSYATQSPNATLNPAPRYGSFLCDTPYSLVMAAFESIPELTGSLDYMIFTGDLVSHDPAQQLSRAYTEYAEVVAYDLFKRLLDGKPVYPVIGNHDTYNEAQDAPLSMGYPLGDQFAWNHDHVSSLWGYNGFLNETTVQYASTHYTAYMVNRGDGLRIITLNTNFWYTPNYFNYINMTDPDVSGMLRFVTDELQAAEDAGDRVWILGHVLSGWDGTNALLNPTNLFYQIVDRYTPHVIANIFYGHTHEDQLSIFYSNNGTNASAETAGTASWIAPSLTPLTNLNSGFRMYEVDSATFDIYEAYTWYADVDSFHALDSQAEVGPAYMYEYSTREAYGESLNWSVDDPLNATWWHLVTEAMEANSTLVQTFNTYQGKSSAMTAACTGECITAKICYMRSGSASIGLENCNPDYSSVQG